MMSFGLAGAFAERTGLAAAPGDDACSWFQVIEYDPIRDQLLVIRRFAVTSYV